MKFVILFMLALNTCIAQVNNDSLENQYCRGIYGYVFDRNNKPISQVKCTAVSQIDTATSYSAFTDSSGCWVLVPVIKGKYALIYEKTGFRMKYISDYVFQENISSLHQDTVILEDEEIITNEIVVEEGRSFEQYETGKSVYNVDAIKSSKGTSVLDALKKIPLVEVDANGNILIRNTPVTSILIDGRNAFSINLRNINTSDVSKIEIITNPAQKYSSETSGGVINIILKKQFILGFNSNLNLNVGTKDKYYVNGSIKTKIKRSYLSLKLSCNSYNFPSDISGSTEFVLGNISRSRTEGSYEAKNISWFAAAAYEYRLSASSTIGLEFFYDKGKYIYNTTTNVSNTGVNTIPESEILNKTFENGDWLNRNLNIYSNSLLKRLGTEINCGYTYIRNKSSNSADIERIIFSPVNLIGQRISYGELSSSEYTVNLFQADIIQPLKGKVSEISSGLNFSVKRNEDFLNNSTLGFNSLPLTERTLSMYVSAHSQFGKCILDLTLRAEQTRLYEQNVPADNIIDRKYFNLFPSLLAGAEYGNNYIELSYSRRINRPQFNKYLPFLNNNDPMVVNTGNKDLLPEYLDVIEFRYNYYNEIFDPHLTFYYKRKTNTIVDYSYTKDSNITVNTYRNIKGTNYYGLEISFNRIFSDVIDLNGYLNVYNIEIQKNSDYQNAISFKFRARSEIKINENLYFSIFCKYYAKRLTYQGYIFPSFGLDLAIGYNFPNESAGISLNAEDIFNSFQTRIYSENSASKSVNILYYDSRVVSLNFFYRFDNTKKIVKEKKGFRENQNDNSGEEE